MWRRALHFGSPRLSIAVACGGTALLAAAAAYGRRVAGVPLVAARDDDGVLAWLTRRELLERRVRWREAAGAGESELEALRALLATERAREAAAAAAAAAAESGGAALAEDAALCDEDLVLR